MADDLAGNEIVADPRRYLCARLGDVLAHLREPERLAVEVRRDDRLRHQAGLRPVDGERRAARLGPARLEHDAREPEHARVAVPLEGGAPLELTLVERDGPAETALVRRHGRVVLDAADDEAALDPEEAERVHPDDLHSLRLQRLDQHVPQLQRAVSLDPELVAELRRVAEPRHEDRDAGDLDVLAKAIVGEGGIGEILVRQRLQQVPAPRPLEAEVRRPVGEIADADRGRLGQPREDLVVAVVRTAEADVLGRGIPPHDGAVVDHLAVLVAKGAVGDLARLELRDVARDDAVDQVECARSVEVDLAQHREVHQPGRLPNRAVLLERIRDLQWRPVAEEIHPVVRQCLQPRVEGRLLAHANSSSPPRVAAASGTGGASDSQTSSVSSRSSSAPWWPEVLIASSYMVTSFGQQTTKWSSAPRATASSIRCSLGRRAPSAFSSFIQIR